MEPVTVEVKMSIARRCQKCGKFGDWVTVRVHWIYGRITGETFVPLCHACIRESGTQEEIRA